MPRLLHPSYRGEDATPPTHFALRKSLCGTQELVGRRQPLQTIDGDYNGELPEVERLEPSEFVAALKNRGR